MTDSPAKLRRRWFRFSLRTLLVGTAVLGCGLGFIVQQVRIVQARSTFLQDRAFAWGDGDYQPYFGSIPFYRRWLGDECIMRIDLRSPNDEVRATVLFPEAVWVWCPPGPEFSLRALSSEESRDTRADGP
jgi:hypothetical protein